MLTGNTASGIYKNWPVEDIIVDVKNVKQLRKILFKTVGCSELFRTSNSLLNHSALCYLHPPHFLCSTQC
jgi:hypothetical protein